MSTGGGGADFVIKIIDQSGGSSGGGGGAGGGGPAPGSGGGSNTPGNSSGGGAGGGGTGPKAPNPPPVPPPKIKPKEPKEPKPPKPQNVPESPSILEAAKIAAKNLFNSMTGMYRSVQGGSYQGAAHSAKNIYQSVSNFTKVLSSGVKPGSVVSTAASAAARATAGAGTNAAAATAAAGAPPVIGGGGAMGAVGTAASMAARLAAASGPILIVTAGLAAMAAAIALTVIGLKKLSSYALVEAERLRGFSPALMQSGMREQLRDRMRNYKAAQALGPGLSAHQDAVGGLKDSMNDVKVQLMRIGVQVLQVLEPFIAFASRMLFDIARVLGVIANQMGPFIKGVMEGFYMMFPVLRLAMKWARSKQGSVADPFLKSTFKWRTPTGQTSMAFAIGSTATNAAGNQGWVLPNNP